MFLFLQIELVSLHGSESCPSIAALRRVLAVLAVACTIAIPSFAQQPSKGFQWPNGKRMALSLTFDDARPSQIDVAMPLLDRYGVKATFFVVPSLVERSLQGWKDAVAHGHEIGNHSMKHPCSVNYRWSAENALEDYSLGRMRNDIVDANRWIKEQLGVTPTSFAFPCGQTFVGRGHRTKSYVPVVADIFTVGRAFDAHSDILTATSFDLLHSDLAQIIGIEMDVKDFDQLLPLLKQGGANTTWVVLVGHEVGPSGIQTTRPAMLEKLIQYAQDPANGVWLAPVAEVAKHVREEREARK